MMKQHVDRESIVAVFLKDKIQVQQVHQRTFLHERCHQEIAANQWEEILQHHIQVVRHLEIILRQQPRHRHQHQQHIQPIRLDPGIILNKQIIK